jgi:hypothetical protein
MMMHYDLWVVIVHYIHLVDVGKTIISAGISRAALKKKNKVCYIKPIQTGTYADHQRFLYLDYDDDDNNDWFHDDDDFVVDDDDDNDGFHDDDDFVVVVDDDDNDDYDDNDNDDFNDDDDDFTINLMTRRYGRILHSTIHEPVG